MTKGINIKLQISFYPHSSKTATWRPVIAHRVCTAEYTDEFRIGSAKKKISQVKSIFPDRNTLCIL